MALPLRLLVSMGGRRSQRPGLSPTLGLLGPSHQRHHKSRESLRGFPSAHGVSGTPHGEVCDIEGENYYCRKSFHSVLLQGIVDTKCVFWNYEFEWAGNMHDWTLFQLTIVGKYCIKGNHLPYKFIGDCAYSVRP